MPRPYQNGLFSCFSPFSTCLKRGFCPCFVVGNNHHRINGDTKCCFCCNSCCTGCCSDWCMGWCVASCCSMQWLFQMNDRKNMQKKHDLEGDNIDNCCTSFWCGGCEVIQTSKELDSLEKDRLTGYVDPQPMVSRPT